MNIAQAAASPGTASLTQALVDRAAYPSILDMGNSVLGQSFETAGVVTGSLGDPSSLLSWHQFAIAILVPFVLAAIMVGWQAGASWLAPHAQGMQRAFGHHTVASDELRGARRFA
jgi:hypothetical protein